jgi:hypothetical protein
MAQHTPAPKCYACNASSTALRFARVIKTTSVCVFVLKCQSKLLMTDTMMVMVMVMESFL